MDKRNKITQKKYMNTSEKSEVATNKEDLGPQSKMSMCMEEQLMHHLYGEMFSSSRCFEEKMTMGHGSEKRDKIDQSMDLPTAKKQMDKKNQFHINISLRCINKPLKQAPLLFELLQIHCAEQYQRLSL